MITEATPDVARMPVIERSNTVAVIPIPASVKMARKVTSFGRRGTFRSETFATNPSQKKISIIRLRR